VVILDWRLGGADGWAMPLYSHTPCSVLVILKIGFEIYSTVELVFYAAQRSLDIMHCNGQGQPRSFTRK